MKANRRYVFITAALVIAVVGIALVLWPRASQNYPGKLESITVSISRLESSAPYWIAEDQHFFAQNGLKVTFKEPDTGLAALDELSKGDADIAAAAEFPVVERIFQKESLRIIGYTAKGDYLYLVGRKDRGIETISDLRGKRVGLIAGTIQAFYLGRYLELHGMTIDAVTLVDVKTLAESVNAIVAGSIDAVVVAEPYASSAEDSLGANALVWPVQSGQPFYGLVVSTEAWARSHPDLVTRLLKSLAQAEEYALCHPAEAKTILQKRLQVDAAFVQAAWSRNQFTLALDQSLIVAMEDEARWLIRNHLTPETEVPNFADYIYEDGLKAVRPEAVNIIR